MPRYANMSDAEADAWVRRGGWVQANYGTVYRPPVLPVPRRGREVVPRLPKLTEHAPSARRLPQKRDVPTTTPASRHLPDGHGTLRSYLAGCHCLDCTNAANEAAMLGEYKP